MSLSSGRMWRPFFVIGGIVYLAGGFQHPRGAMVDMLRDPVWFRAHATSFLGLLLLTVGFSLFRKATPASGSTDRWILLTIVATALEAVEMAVHTMSYVDAAAMASGHSTPVFMTHAWLATIIYPIFAIALIGLIRTTQRDRLLGSPWIGWIGMLGAVAHGVVMFLILMEIFWSPILFPISVISLSIWFVLSGLWPVRQSAAGASVGDVSAPGLAS